MTQFLLIYIYIYKYIFKYIKDFSLLHCDLKMLVSESTRVCWFLPCVRYLLCVLFALFSSVLMGVWTVTVHQSPLSLSLCVAEEVRQ